MFLFFIVIIIIFIVIMIFYYMKLYLCDFIIYLVFEKKYRFEVSVLLMMKILFENGFESFMVDL